jgi:CHASE3 domain sensor protein
MKRIIVMFIIIIVVLIFAVAVVHGGLHDTEHSPK